MTVFASKEKRNQNDADAVRSTLNVSSGLFLSQGWNQVLKNGGTIFWWDKWWYLFSQNFSSFTTVFASEKKMHQNRRWRCVWRCVQPISRLRTPVLVAFCDIHVSASGVLTDGRDYMVGIRQRDTQTRNMMRKAVLFSEAGFDDCTSGLLCCRLIGATSQNSHLVDFRKWIMMATFWSKNWQPHFLRQQQLRKHMFIVIVGRVHVSDNSNIRDTWSDSKVIFGL